MFINSSINDFIGLILRLYLLEGAGARGGVVDGYCDRPFWRGAHPVHNDCRLCSYASKILFD